MVSSKISKTKKLSQKITRNKFSKKSQNHARRPEIKNRKQTSG